ncbi:MAG: hypothetical protein AB9880_01205 [Christensenellales bacterium]
MLHRKSVGFLAFLLMICMMASAILWGAHKGWSAQRLQVDEALDSLRDMLGTRSEVIANILTVASRHLPKDDEQLSQMRLDRDLLTGRLDLPGKAAANERLGRNAEAVLSRLAADPAVQGDARDNLYVTQMLPQALDQSQSLVQEAAYNTQAADFNQRLLSSFSGALARFLGIQPAQQFLAPAEATP